MKQGILLSLALGLVAGCATYIGYMYGYQTAELQYEKAMSRAALSPLSQCEVKKEEKLEAPQE